MGKPLAEIFKVNIVSAFYESGLILGAKGSPALFQDRTVVTPDDVYGPLEFHYCNFTGPVHCAKGQKILFRNCRFSGQYGISVGETAPGHVVVESCVFEGNETSLTLKPDSRVTLLNCSFHKCGVAVDLVEGSSALVVHCSFVDTSNCIAMRSKGKELDVVNCSFDTSQSGVLVRNGGSVRVRGCRFRNFNYNVITVEGPKLTTLLIEDCVITDSKMGVFASVGKVQLTMVNTEIARCFFYGVMLSQDLLGSTASFTNCRIAGNERSDILNLCDHECVITTDGVIQPFDYVDFQLRFMRAEPIFEEIRRWQAETHGQRFIALKRLRKIKATGMLSVKCAKCAALEPEGEKYKACSKCKNVVYCSRECQVAHWKEHKKECGNDEYS